MRGPVVAGMTLLLVALPSVPVLAAPMRQPVAPVAPADPNAVAGPGWSYRLRLGMMLDRARLVAGLPAEGGDAIPRLVPLPMPAGIGSANVPLPVPAESITASLRVASVERRKTPRPAAPTPETVAAPLTSGGTLNVLVLGSDRRPGEGSWRTDSMVLVSLDQTARRVGMLSIPRDLWVDIPGYGSGRINTADYLGYAGGMADGDLIKETVRQNLGVPVDRFIRVNFQALVQAVDTLGGIDLVVDCPLEDYFLDDGVAGPGEVSLDTGVHHVDGATALRYARSRHSTSDFDRSKRQQRVMRSMIARAREKGLLRAAPGMLASMREHIQTDLGLAEIVGLGLMASRLSDLNVHAGGLDFHQLTDWTTPEGAMVLLADPAAVASKLDEVLAGTDEATDAVPAGSVALVDHTGRAGWDRVASARLGEARIGVASTRPGATSPGTALYYRAGHEDLATVVATALGIPEQAKAPIEDLPPALRLGADVQVVLGDDWAPDCP